MRDLITDLQKSGTWKFQLTIAVNFLLSIDVDEERVMHLKRNNIDVLTYDNVNDIVDELFESLLSRYHICLETSMREGDFIFDLVQLLYYKSHKNKF